MRDSPKIEALTVAAYKIPTDQPESDGTLEWDHTILVTVEVRAGGKQGFGYTYADTATAHLITEKLRDVVVGHDAFDVPGAFATMGAKVRNLGRPGVSAMAIAAVDAALWDLKARLCELSLAALLGAMRDRVPVYGSGGFTSYTTKHLQEQLAGWVSQGIPRVKMKIGREPLRDLDRVRAARKAIGDGPQLFVDANGAYSHKQALALGRAFAELGVVWFEEPVGSDDLEGLHRLREHLPMDVAAGEYGYEIGYFQRMLAAQSVDVLQADATRCGITGFIQAATLCDAMRLSFSGHCAPSIHAHVACAVPRLRNLEYFHDHARIEHLLFEGVLSPRDGALHPDRSRPGMGVELKRADAERFRLSL